MQYASGLAALVSFSAAAPMPRHGLLWLAARGMLDVAGTLFGCYLVVFLVMMALGSARMYRPPADRTPRRGTGRTL